MNLEQRISNTVWQRNPDDVTMAQTLMGYLETPCGIKPIITQGSVYTYSAQLGIWEEHDREKIRSLVQLFSGTRIPVLAKAKQENGNTKEEWTFKAMHLNNAKIVSVANCVFRIGTLQNSNFFDGAVPGIAFLNGFVKVDRNGLELVPHSPDHCAQHNVMVDFVPNRHTPQWEATLSKVFSRTPDSENAIKALQQFAGACLVGKATKYTRAIVLVGEGSNGKTTLQDTIKSLFPAGAVTFSSPHSWAERFATARLKTSLLNIAGELPNKAVAAADRFKTILDGGAIDAEKKGQDHFSLYPRAGHFFSSNHIPHSDDSSTGFWRRLIILPCWYDFSKDQDKQPKEEIVENLARERAGIITWALEGAVQLMRQGDYTIPECSTAIIQDAQVDSDPVKSWLADNCDTSDSTIWSSTEDLWKNFKASSWAEGTAIQKTGFAKRLVELGFQRKTNQHVKLRGFISIEIKKRSALDQALLEHPITRMEREWEN